MVCKIWICACETTITKTATTSTVRFKLVIGNHTSKVDTVSFYKVMARATDGTVDVVAVFVMVVSHAQIHILQTMDYHHRK